MPREITLTVEASGSAGSSAGTSDLTLADVVTGFIQAVKITYTSAPATTDVILSEYGGAEQTFLSVPNNNTNVVKYPLAQGNLNTDGSAITGVYERLWIGGRKFTASVAGANDDTSVTLLIVMID